jgi:hypothetical protein
MGLLAVGVGALALRALLPDREGVPRSHTPMAPPACRYVAARPEPLTVLAERGQLRPARARRTVSIGSTLVPITLVAWSAVAMIAVEFVPPRGPVPIAVGVLAGLLAIGSGVWGARRHAL